MLIAVTACQCSTLEIHGPQLPPPIHEHPHHGVVPIVPPQPVQILHNHHAHPTHESPHVHPAAFVHRSPAQPHPISQHDHSIVHQVPHHGHPVIHQIPIHEGHLEHHYHHQPVHIHPEYYSPPKYDFGYNIFDPHTGDIKNQYEHRNGGSVRGTYSFIEADGQRRIVEYSSDPSTGFNALVRHEPLGYGRHI